MVDDGKRQSWETRVIGAEFWDIEWEKVPEST